jgi:hypothetical protein
MRIVIETDAGSAPAAGEVTVTSPEHGNHVEDAGAGLSAAQADTAATAASDTGPPPAWLATAIARAMSESAANSGVKPAAPESDAIEDGGAGPSHG